MTQTFAESKGDKPFNWNKFLDKAIAGEASSHELEIAKDLSGGWVTCACGNLCAAIPRKLGGEPVDLLLGDLGCEFSEHIVDANYHTAKHVLQQIELRSTELLTAMQTNQPE